MSNLNKTQEVFVTLAAQSVVIPDNTIASYSDLGKHAQCKRAWWLATYRRLRPLDEPMTGPLPFGSRIHSALEAYYDGTVPSPVLAWTALMGHEYAVDESNGGFNAAKLDKESKLGHTMLEGYLEWIEETGEDAKYEVIGVEDQLNQHVTLPIRVDGEDRHVSVLIRGKLDRRLRRKSDGAVLVGDFKALPLDEPIATPTGWATIGQLSVGDQILGASHQPTTVLGTYDLGEDEVYRVEFNDGTWVRASGDHLWTVQRSVSSRRWLRREPVTVKTSELRYAHKGSEDWVAPITPVRDDQPADLPVHPYVLGVWLGDGSRITEGWKTGQRVPISLGEDGKDILLKVSDLTGAPVSTVSTAGRRDQFRISVPIRRELTRLGLVDKKSPDRWVPVQYLRASYLQRLDLLRGLMDTDGNVMTSGSTNYQTTSERLAEDVADLVRSLGGWARVVKNKTANRYRLADGELKFTGTWTWRVSIRLDVNPFDRHAARAVKWEGAAARSKTKVWGHRAKLVKNVVPLGRAQVRCIRVDAQDSLFLTRFLTPTHNTTASVAETAIADQLASPQPRLYLLLERHNSAPHQWSAGFVITMLRKVLRTKTSSPPYYVRLEHNVTEVELQAYTRRLKGAVEDLATTKLRLDAGRDPHEVAYFNPGWWCRSCPFKLACDLMQTQPAGAEAMLTDLFYEGDPWSRYLSPAGADEAGEA